jgi:RND family efflux transporter MFP subunit
VLADEEEAAAMESARATLDLARLEHERALQLREKNLLSQADLEQAAYRIRATQAMVREAEVRLGYTRIRAPFAGVLSRRFIRVGQSVEKAEPLFRVTALSPLRAQIRVPELQARTLARGQTLRFRSPGGEEVTGSISRIAPAVDPASGTVEVLVSIPSPGGLRPGSAVTVALHAQP